MMKTCFDLIKKYREVILYLVFGVLTTIVSLATYTLFTKTFLNPTNDIELQIANVLSWIISVLFAYITNRKFVFTSKDPILKELPKFTLARVFSLLLDMFIMFIGVSLLNKNDKLVKLLSQVLVVVFNYIASKLFIFKKNV